MILIEENVGKKGEKLELIDEKNGDKGEGEKDRKKGINKRKRGEEKGWNRGRKVRLSDLGKREDSIGEMLGGRKNRMDWEKGKIEMEDLEEERRKNEESLKERIGREIVMKNEGLIVG